MLKKLVIVISLVLGLGVAPISVTPAHATNCLSVTDNYASSPDNSGYYNMYQCYKIAGLQATESSCSKYLQDAISYYRLQFSSSAFSSVIKYDNCRAILPKSPSSITSAGGTTGGSQSSGVVSPSCSAPPEPPLVISKHTLSGLSVSITPNNAGQPRNGLAYTVNFYDSAQKKWLGWSSWTNFSGALELQYTKPTETQTRVALSVLAHNYCGNSAKAYLSADGTGLPILNPPVDEISQVITSVNVGVSVKVDQLATTLSGRPFTIQVLTPKVCQVSNGILTAKSAGACSVTLTSAGSDQLVSKTSTVKVTMAASSKTITCYKKGNSKVTKKVTAVAPKCPTGYSTKK